MSVESLPVAGRSEDGPTSDQARSGISDGRRRTLGFLVAFVLRYGWVGIGAAAVVGADVAVLMTRGAPWRGDLVWTLDWLPIAFVLVAPLVAGFVAIDTARLTVGSRHVWGVGWRTPDTGVALGYAAVLAVVHVAVVVGAVVVSRPPHLHTDSFLAVFAQITMLWFFVALGSLVGRFSNPVLGGIVAALVAVGAVFLLSTPGRHVALLDGGAATVPRIGFAYDSTYLVYQLGALALAIVALSFVRPRGAGGVRSIRGGLLAVAAVLLVGAVSVALVGPGDRLRTIAAAPSSCGAVVTVPVCVYPEHRRVVGAFDDELWALFSAAQEKGYGALVPAKVVESSQTSWEGTQEVGSIFVNSDNLSGDEPSTWQVALDLVQPLHCDGLRGQVPPQEQYWEDLNALVGTWVMLVDPELGEVNGFYGTPLPIDEATDLMDQFRTCTYPFT